MTLPPRVDRVVGKPRVELALPVAGPFENAQLEWPLLGCSCGKRYDLVRAGRSENDESLFAEPFPLVRDGDRIRVAIPVGA